MPFRSILLAALVCAAAAAQGPSLRQEWETTLGPTGDGPWLMAVCPNGVVYAADARGRLVALSAEGRILARAGEPALYRARDLACDSNGLLYAARTDNLAVLRLAGNRFETVRQARPEAAITAMTIGARGRIFAAGRRPGSRLPLHVLEPDGRVLHSFGETPRGPLIPAFEPLPLLLWQTRPERLLVVSSAPYEIHAYAPDGGLLEVVRPRRRGYIHPVQFTPGGDITGAAVLPRGQIVVQLRTHGPLTNQPDTFLDLLDADLRIVAGGIPAVPGALAGASSSGALYFFDARVRPSIIKGRLSGGSAGTRVLAWNHEVFRVFLCCPVRDYRAGFGKVPG